MTYIALYVFKNVSIKTNTTIYGMDGNPPTNTPLQPGVYLLANTSLVEVTPENKSDTPESSYRADTQQDPKNPWPDPPVTELAAAGVKYSADQIRTFLSARGEERSI